MNDQKNIISFLERDIYCHICLYMGIIVSIANLRGLNYTVWVGALISRS